MISADFADNANVTLIDDMIDPEGLNGKGVHFLVLSVKPSVRVQTAGKRFQREKIICKTV